MYKPISSQIFMATLRGLNFWTLKQKIKDHTVEKTPTFRLQQRIDIIKWNNPNEVGINTAMLSTFNYKPKTNLNLRFKSDLSLARERFIKMHGKVERTTGNMPSHSFVLQFMQQLEVIFAHSCAPGIGPGISDPVMIKDAGGTVRTVRSNSFRDYAGNDYSSGCFAIEASVTEVRWGIVVGTGTNTPTGYDYVLQTKILHGISSGQLYYGACTVGGATVAGSNTDMTVIRLFGNSSGGAITIREIGLMTCQWVSSSDNHYDYLIARDAVNQTVNNGETAVVLYTLRTTV